MTWMRWEDENSPQMPTAQRQAVIHAVMDAVVAGDPPTLRADVESWLLDVCTIVEVERNEIDPSGIFLDPVERFEIKKRIHAGLAQMSMIRNFRLARTEFEDAFIEMWHDE
jgi:hypothetical protein